MSSLGSPSPFLFGKKTSLSVERSLRFNSADDAYLSRTPSSAGNRKTWTWSAWLKFCSTSTGNCVFSGGSNCFNDRTAILFPSGIINTDLCGIGAHEISEGHFKDFTAWYHFVWAFDTTQATASNRSKIYVNGSEISVTRPRNWSQNTDYGINNNTLTTIGTFSNSIGSYSFDGYMAEINFIDGQQLTPSSFGETDATTGQWNPIDTSGLTFGSNGFRLQFKDNSSTTTLGEDTSGNGNDFTLNNFSVSAGVNNDSLEDTPTNNWCTLNPLTRFGTTSPTLSNGNLNFDLNSNNMYPMSTFLIPKSGKWYAEIVFTAVGAGGVIGVQNPVLFDPNGTSSTHRHNAITYVGDTIRVDDSSVQTSVTSLGVNNIIGICVDRDAGTVLFKNNNSDVGVAQALSASAGSTEDLVFTAGKNSSGGSNVIGYFNFGQRAFSYTPPTGFKALNSANLPDPTILLPNKHFDTLLYTGNGSTQSITGLEFQPDWVWAKNRSGANSHVLYDAVRGATKELLSNSTNSEATESTGLTSFDSNGFTAGSNGGINGSGGSYVAWNWNGGGTTVTNTNGTISAQVKANTTAGFSIATWVGNGSSGSTIGHGLGVTPNFCFIKRRDASGQNWIAASFDLESARELNTGNAFSTGDYDAFFPSQPSSGIVTLSNNDNCNRNTATYVGYFFSSVSGYSKISTYVGNGSTDGTFVFTGFRPAWILVKRTSASEDWALWDNKRDGGINPNGYLLRPNSSTTEGGNVTAHQIDILSNGFKFRNNDSKGNGSGSTYIYLAFAETPFKNARAR